MNDATMPSVYQEILHAESALQALEIIKAAREFYKTGYSMRQREIADINFMAATSYLHGYLSKA